MFMRRILVFLSQTMSQQRASRLKRLGYLTLQTGQNPLGASAVDAEVDSEVPSEIGEETPNKDREIRVTVAKGTSAQFVSPASLETQCSLTQAA